MANEIDVGDVVHYGAKYAQVGAAKLGFTALNGGKNFISQGVDGAIKNIATKLNQALGGSAVGVGTVSATAGSSWLPIISAGIGIGITTAISAAIAQVDYRHDIDTIKKTYTDEIAAKVGKKGKDITNDDVYALANGDPKRGIAKNKTISEAVSRARKKRIFGIGLAMAATFGALALLGSGIISTAAMHTTFGGFAWLAESAVGVALYSAIKEPLKFITHKVMGFSKSNTNDLVKSLAHEHRHGRSVSQEQVLEVFVSAHPQLGRMIKAEYHADYNSMPIEQKRRVTKEVGKLIPLGKIADDINDGNLNASELAFIVDGQVSGALPNRDHDKRGLLSRGVSWCKEKIFGSKEPSFNAGMLTPAEPGMVERRMEVSTGHPAKAGHDFNNPHARVGHADRLRQQRQVVQVAQVSPVSHTVH